MHREGDREKEDHRARHAQRRPPSGQEAEPRHDQQQVRDDHRQLRSRHAFRGGVAAHHRQVDEAHHAAVQVVEAEDDPAHDEQSDTHAHLRLQGGHQPRRERQTGARRVGW